MNTNRGIYAITHEATGRRYIGSAVNVDRRWSQHRSELARGVHKNPKLQSAWNKYGADAFTFSVLELVVETPDLVPAEQRWLDARPHYNIATVAGSQLGFRHSDASKARMSEASKGRPITAEHRAKLSSALRGRVVSAETREKIASTQRGRPISAEHRAKLIKARAGRVIGPETRAKQAAAAKARVWSAESRAKISAANLRRGCK